MSGHLTYLQSYKDYFWQYEDVGKVIVIPDGQTIGYSRMILQEIVIYLAPYGLPRFGSLLLGICATNPHGLDMLESILKIVLSRVEEVEEISEGIWFAKLLSQVPTRFKQGKLRIDLLRSVFKDSHNSKGKLTSTSISKSLLQNFEVSNYSGVLNKVPIENAEIIKDFKTLALIGRKLNSVDEIVRNIANLPYVEQNLDELEFLKERDEKDTGIVDELIRDNRTYYIASLVPKLMSGLNIPFHSSLPSQQPLGGVADITNKGNFDKLLISEFVFDDSILMSRLANNESLYHHREAPPSDNKYSRIIIIDVTLKNWGNIRTIAFACMLAITKHPKNKNPYRVFMVGKTYKEVEVETMEDILDALQILDHSLDPGVGMMELFSSENIAISEMFFIASAKSLNEPIFQKFNAEYGKRIDHWIHPTDGGQVSVYKNPKRGKRFIQELNINLNDTWNNPPIKDKQLNPREEYNYPILFPASKVKNSVEHNSSFYVCSRENSLFRINRFENSFNRKGWEMIYLHFPGNLNLKAVLSNEDSTLIALVKDNLNIFSLIQLSDGKKIEVENKIGLHKIREFRVEDQRFVGENSSESFFVNLDGTVEKGEIVFRVKVENKFIRKNLQVYKNLTSISISKSNSLWIGKHELIIKNRHIYLQNSKAYTNSMKIELESSRDGVFKFMDGSRIEHNRNGILTFISANSDIPKFHIPLLLNKTLGIATDEKFAGRDYFRFQQKGELLLSGLITNKLDIVKRTKEMLGYTLKETKEMVDFGSITSTEIIKIQKLHYEFIEAGIESQYRESGLVQEEMEPHQFFSEFVQPFINEIVEHAD